MADQANPKFQVPPEIQNFAEQSFDQARKAFESFFSVSQRAVSNFENQAAAAHAGAKDVQQRAVTYTQRNIAASFDFAQKLLQAKNPEEVIRLHAEHVQAQIESLTEQAREIGRTATLAMKPGGRP